MAIVYRLVKNSELTWVELDGNFSFLDDKIDQVAAQTGSTEIVRVTPQVFLPAEEDQARVNIKAASVDQVIDLNDRVDFLETYNPVMYTPQILSPTEQQTARENINVYSKEEVDDKISTATQPKTKGYFEHVLTASDIANSIMTFTLPETPTMTEWEFLYIGAGILSPVSYSVSGNVLSIDQSTISYPVQVGRRLLFRYMY